MTNDSLLKNIDLKGFEMSENSKTSLIQKMVATLLSLLLFFLVLPATFTFPIELVFFNKDYYYQKIQDQNINEILRPLVVKIFVDQVMSEKNGYVLPNIFSNTDVIENAMISIITDEWLNEELENMVDQSMNYLNFQSPKNIIEIDITPVKNKALSQSLTISDSIFNSLPYCSKQEESIFQEELLSIIDIPACRPGAAFNEMSKTLINRAVEDFINMTPNRYTIGFLNFLNTGNNIPENQNYFYLYTVVRWVLRLLPIFSLSVLLLIVIALKNDKTLMFKWIGKLLIVISVVNLVILVVTIIGFDQISALLFNVLLSQFVTNWGEVFFVIFRNVGIQTLLWVALTNILLFLIGVLFRVRSRWVKKEKAPDYEYEDVIETKKEMLSTMEDDDAEIAD